MKAPVDVPPPLTCRRVTDQEVAMTTLHGDDAGFSSAAMALVEAMVTAGLAEGGRMFSRHLAGPTQATTPADYVTEICIPI